MCSMSLVQLTLCPILVTIIGLLLNQFQCLESFSSLDSHELSQLMQNASEYPARLDDDNILKKFAESHDIKNVKIDSHLYYNSTFIDDHEKAEKLWVNLDGVRDVKRSDLLSKSHRRAATIKLKFEFPFYGHSVSSVTIATGGFLYTGDYVHAWLAATQYIAPLMANFDTSLSNNSFIEYYDNGASFTVQWTNVSLQEKPDSGNFTFQTTIYKDGRIVLVYKNIPFPIEDIKEVSHPVKVGISDAYIHESTVFYIRRKTIYEYHKVNFKKYPISNWTAIELIPLPSCMANKDCQSCFTNSGNFDCIWCPGANLCSDGVSRRRQDWVDKNCTIMGVKSISQCDDNAKKPLHGDISMVSTQRNWEDNQIHRQGDPQRIVANDKSQEHGHFVSSLVFSIFCILILFASVLCWVAYAYINPHTSSGQFLIRYRPSQWNMKRGEARYTAATIHI